MAEKTYKAQLLTPEGSLFEGDVFSVTVPGQNGNFQVLYNHAPIVSSLGMGKITIEPEDRDAQHYAVKGGFVEMSRNEITILAEKAIRSDNIDVEEVNHRLNEIQNELEGFAGDRDQLEYDLAVAKNELNVAQS